MCERRNFQVYNCALTFGPDYLELWCPACAAEFQRWLDDQAEEARALDRMTGLGWLWEQVTAPSSN